jgi:hypothetical protein
MEAEFKNYRSESRDTNWGTQDKGLSLDQINAGSLLRIADSLERMEEPYLKLHRDLDNFKRWYIQERNIKEDLQASLRGTKAWSTRQKNKIQNLEARIKELEATNERS